jgi:hypothetical protein
VNGMIARICNIQIAVVIHGQAVTSHKQCIIKLARIAGAASMGGARRYASNCRDDPVRCTFADQAVGRVRDERSPLPAIAISEGPWN